MRDVLDLASQLRLQHQHVLSQTSLHHQDLALLQLLVGQAKLLGQEGLTLDDQGLAVDQILVHGLEVLSVVLEVLSLLDSGFLGDALVLGLDEVE